MPHLALPSLTAYLRQHGVTVVQRDLNAEVFDKTLTRRALTERLARLHERLAEARRAGNDPLRRLSPATIT